MAKEPLLVPEVKLNGSVLTPTWLARLTELRVELQFQVPARVTLRFADPDYGLLGQFQLGESVTVTVGDPRDSEPWVAAEVISVASEQRERDTPEMVLIALDRSYRLGQATRAHAFLKSTYADVVRTVVQDSGLNPDVDATPEGTFDYIPQAGTDMALVSDMARRSGFDWWVTGTTFHFKKPAGGPEVKLEMAGDLRSFSARASTLRPGKVIVGGWDRDNKQSILGQASSSDLKADSKLVDKLSHPTYQLFTAAQGVQSQQEADALAQAILERGATAAVTAKGVAVGNGDIALGTTAVIEDAGPLSGSYPVTSVEHVFRPASGFLTRFSSGERRPTNLVDVLGAPSGIYQGGYPGSTAFARRGVSVAVVTSINDPKSSGRVKVRFFGGTGQVETDWARVVTVGGGAERGSVWIPEVNDEVLIAFEDSDARSPVVIGGLYGAVDKMPATQIKDGMVQSRAMTSRKGHAITMFDGEEDQDLAIEMALNGKQHKLRLGKDALVVEVPSGKPVTIKAGSSKIEFAKSGDITISAPNITLKADQSVKVQAPQVSIQGEQTLDLKSEEQAKLSGTILDIKGTAMTKVAGGMVQIN